ncbi:hypothetical protein TRFO_43227 [Tritrichomonas foetus]|uniref:Uncharacterized protein n=1 Tax=Tritrichomonas foetus TaxID=1144522 RepID=A0A1J4KVS0_9EUKA|nr:hypothetical protein TRFO_43227 [Tritrichomonas foetus]|eukprot:OHT13844.1 hypothetical protein TRFO_43227 [Tritrichomonas foetus]
MLFLFLAHCLSISLFHRNNDRFKKLIQEAKQSAINKKVQSEEKSFTAGHHNLGAISFDLNYDLFNGNTPEVRGLAFDDEYLAVIPNPNKKIMFSNHPVYVHRQTQKLFQLRKVVSQEDEVVIYSTQEVDFYKVFKKIVMGTFVNPDKSKILAEKVEKSQLDFDVTYGGGIDGKLVGRCKFNPSYDWDKEANEPNKNEINGFTEGSYTVSNSKK